MKNLNLDDVIRGKEKLSQDYVRRMIDILSKKNDKPHEIIEKLVPLNPYGVSKNEFDKFSFFLFPPPLIFTINCIPGNCISLKKCKRLICG